MFPRIDNFIEHWAQIYKPIMHCPLKGAKGRRFFRFDSIETAQDITKQFTTFKTPVVGIVTQFDGVSHGTLMELEVIVFAFTKQMTPRSDTSGAEIAAADAKAIGADILNDLWIWICDQKRRAPKDPKNDLHWINGIDTDNIAIMSYPVMLNDWWPTTLELKIKVPRQTCIDTSKYLE